MNAILQPRPYDAPTTDCSLPALARALLHGIPRERDLALILVQDGYVYFGYVLPRAQGRAHAAPCAACAGQGHLQAATAFGRALRVDCPVCQGIGRLDLDYSDFSTGYEDARLSDIAHFRPQHPDAPPFDATCPAVHLTRAEARAHLRRLGS